MWAHLLKQTYVYVTSTHILQAVVYCVAFLGFGKNLVKVSNREGIQVWREAANILNKQ
jgi:hypothetical protein